jgi:hypothetical protein
MNLAAQIGLITVPQEFTRLCNVILTAEHGDEYLPIDDDRSDRGNDGYLKSEKRLFAAHCFKRVQNQSIDADIRGKMVGDLGKAIALKKEGIWDIVAWTFLCNYKISEEIGARLIQLGQDAHIDVSWRGPDELAAGIQKHQAVLDQFPDLQANKISEQLGDIHTSLAALAGAVGQSATVAQAAASPRTPEEQRQLLLSRPDGWEYLLFAGVLYQSTKALDGKWRDHELRLPRGPRQHLDPRAATDYLGHTFDDFIGALAPITQLFTPTALAEAFGKPGEAGDPGRIEHFARRVAGMYEDLLDWAATMRSLDVPDPLKRSMELASQVADQPIDEFRAFIDRTVKETDRLPALLAAPDPEPLTIKLELVLTADKKLLAELDQELKRATAQIVSEAKSQDS